MDDGDIMTEIEPRERKKVTYGLTYKVPLPENCGNLYITINSDNIGLTEVFIIRGKSGGCINAWSEAVARLVSLALSSGIPSQHIIKQLKGV